MKIKDKEDSKEEIDPKKSMLRRAKSIKKELQKEKKLKLKNIITKIKREDLDINIHKTKKEFKSHSKLSFQKHQKKLID